ncbi:MAG: 8-amino-7-oxononanoate synthase [Dehalococcoidia bacterium]|nr:8-amino-7-oxononanoate synthase [Dehalococcoidia bacterium]
MKQELAALGEKGLRRSLRPLDTAPGPWVTMDGKRVLLLCSNDYLDLASHPSVKAAAQAAIETWGCGAGSARLIAGSLEPHRTLEERLARFLGTEAALLFGSGYMANLGAISALAGPGDAIFSDQFNHASIVDGCRLSGARVHVYPHRDVEALEAMLGRAEAFRRRLIVTEGLFSMEGDLAPLHELACLAVRYEALFMVDDAHGIGTLGEEGRGALEHLGLETGVHILVGTLGKALGSGGAFVAGSLELVDFLVNRARPFIFSTALAPSLAAAATAALEIVQQELWRRHDLLSSASYLKKGLIELGFKVLGEGTAIVPVIIGDPARTMEMSRLLLEEGIFVQGLRPPTVPPGACRLRCSLMATHTREDLDMALDVFQRVGKGLGVIS